MRQQKIKIGSMLYVLYKHDNPGSVWDSAILPGKFRLAIDDDGGLLRKKNQKRWLAELNGPWYADSNPSGTGDTAQEAVDDLLKNVRELQSRLGEIFERTK